MNLVLEPLPSHPISGVITLEQGTAASSFEGLTFGGAFTYDPYSIATMWVPNYYLSS